MARLILDGAKREETEQAGGWYNPVFSYPTGKTPEQAAVRKVLGAKRGSRDVRCRPSSGQTEHTGRQFGDIHR